MVKNQKSSLPSWIIICASVTKGKHCVQLIEIVGNKGTYLDTRESLSEETRTWSEGESRRGFTQKGTACERPDAGKSFMCLRT